MFFHEGKLVFTGFPTGSVPSRTPNRYLRLAAAQVSNEGHRDAFDFDRAGMLRTSF
jgi:hypothetical protein